MGLEVEMEDRILVRSDLLRLRRREAYRGDGEEGNEKTEHVLCRDFERFTSDVVVKEKLSC